MKSTENFLEIMPKKLSTNTKATEARDKKAAEKKVKADAEEKQKEDGKLDAYNFALFLISF